MKTARTEDKSGPQMSKSDARSGETKALGSKSEIATTRGPLKQAVRSPDTQGGTPPASALNHQQIKERAKAIWEQRGRVTGNDQADWYEAESQLKGK